jgi:hypothetical protein
MVNNFTNINKTNNHLSTSLTEHNETTTKNVKSDHFELLTYAKQLYINVHSSLEIFTIAIVAIVTNQMLKNNKNDSSMLTAE